MSQSRIVIYTIASLFALLLLLFPYYLANSKRNLAKINSLAAATSSTKPIKTFSSYYKKIRGGFVLTLYTGHDPSFLAEYVTISKINDKYFVNLITGPGIEGAILLEGQEALDFLREHEIDVSKFN